MSLSSLSVKRPVATLMMFAIVVVIGGVFALKIPIDLLPDITYPAITIQTTYSGTGPAEIEQLVTKPLEKVVSTVSNVKEVTSISQEDTSIIFVSFNWGTDIDEAANDIRERISLMEGYLPEDTEKPVIFKFDTSMIPVMILGLTGDEDLAYLRKLAEEKISYQLERVEGVAAVSVGGGRERQIQIEVDKGKLAAVGLSLSQVVATLRAENLNLPAGFLESSQKEYLVRTMGEFTSIEDIKNTVIAYRNSAPLYLKDIAQVKDSYKEKRGEVRVNGKEAIMLTIQKQSGANTVGVSTRVHQELKEIKKELPPGIGIDIIIDTAEYIRDSISQLTQTMVLAAIITFFVVLFFLGNFPATVTIFLAIPLSILSTFILMGFADLTLNIMTLGGLALGVGMMVDNAIVVAENIFRHREEGKSPREAAIFGSSEVGMAITASTLTTIVVFISLLFVTGIISIFFKHLSYTVVFSLFSSLMMALTIVPLLASRFLKKDNKSFFSPVSWGVKVFNKLERRYSIALNLALSHRKSVIFGFLGLLVFSLILFLPRIGQEFFPRSDQGEFTIGVELPPDTPWEVTRDVCARLENYIKERIPEVDSILTQVPGAGFFGLGGGASHKGQIRVSLVDIKKRERSTQEIVDDFRKNLPLLPQAEVTIEQAGFGGGVLAQAPLVVEIKGYDLEKAKDVAEKITSLMKNTPGVVDPVVSYEKGKPELQIKIDREKASTLGLSVSQISQVLRTANLGKVATYYREGGDEYEILVRLREKDRKNIQDIKSIYFTLPSGENINLEQIAKVNLALGPVSIERKDQERIITVSADISGRDLGSIGREIETKIASLSIPEGLRVELTGQQSEMAESFRDLSLAILLAIILVYMVMAAQFESFRHPFVIMFTIPLAAIGVLLILLLTGTNLNVVVYMGAMVLVGIVVNNGIVMVSYINILRERGKSVMDAVREGARRRLRPILMTAFTTILALVPLSVGMGAGAELWSPLGKTVIGGLAASTFLTLFFVPVLYTYLAGKGEKH